MSPTDAERLATLEAGMTEVRGDIREIKDQLLGRPSWSVALVLTLLSSLTVGLAVALAAQLGS